MYRSSWKPSAAVLLVLISLQAPQVADSKRIKDYLLPAVQLHPTVEMPFVFLHQRKCGGTSIRAAVYTGAVELGLEAASFVPCINAHCVHFKPDLAASTAFAIFACHCNWYTVIPKDRDYACMSTFRHPVSRAVSCLYFRFPDRFRPEILANISTTEFRAMLMNTFHDMNATCSNEVLHILSGKYNPIELDGLLENPVSANALIQEAILNMQRCTVLISSDGSEASRTELNSWNARVLKHWHPWIGEVGRLNENLHSDIPTHLISVIHELNWPEMQVYNAAMQRYKEQQRMLQELDAISVSEHLA